MPLSPAQMGHAILRNLEAKTGHGLDYWLEVLYALDAPDAKTAKAGLKAAGLGHFQAQKVYEASQGEDPYGDPDALLDALFPLGTRLRDAYAAFAKTCRAHGGNVTARPCRTYVPFYAKTTFAIARPGLSGQTVDVGIALGHRKALDGLAVTGEGFCGNERVTHVMTLPPDGVPTGAQAEVLAKAYWGNRG